MPSPPLNIASTDTFMNDTAPDGRGSRPLRAGRARVDDRDLSGWPLFFGILRRYRALILMVCALCVLTAVVYALTATPIYRAESVITVVRPDSNGGTAS